MNRKCIIYGAICGVVVFVLFPAVVFVFTSKKTDKAKASKNCKRTEKLPPLDNIDKFNTAECRDALLKYLCSNKEWHVKYIDNAIVARLTPLDKNGHRFINEPEQHYETGVLIRFTPYPERYILRQSSYVFVDPNYASVRYDPAKHYWPKNGKSYFRLLYHSKYFWIEIHDHGRHFQFTWIKKMIVKVNKMLAEVYRDRENILKKGYSAIYTPKGSFVISTTEIKPKLIEGGHFRRFHVTGYTNQGQFGYLYVKLYDDRGKLINAGTANFPMSSEFPGWSDNPDEKFYYEIDISFLFFEYKYYNKSIRCDIYFCPISIEGHKICETTSKIYKAKNER